MGLEDAKSEVDTAFTRKGLRGYAFENAFGGATSFLRRTYTKDLTGVDLAVTGVPFDQAVTHRTGTRFGLFFPHDGFEKARVKRRSHCARPRCFLGSIGRAHPNRHAPLWRAGGLRKTERSDAR